jgi:hypothetical protein
MMPSKGDFMSVEKIAARYIGTHAVRLVASQGPYFDAFGKRLTNLSLSYGDTLMMPVAEVLGKTQLRDGDSLYDLGPGKVVKPEHQNKDEAELAHFGYEFHQGRPDFEPYTPVEENQ